MFDGLTIVLRLIISRLLFSANVRMLFILCFRLFLLTSLKHTRFQHRLIYYTLTSYNTIHFSDITSHNSARANYIPANLPDVWMFNE